MLTRFTTSHPLALCIGQRLGQILSLSSRFTFATGEILSSLVRSFESNDATALQLYSPANDNGRLVIAAGIFMNSGHDHEDDEGGEKKEGREKKRRKNERNPIKSGYRTTIPSFVRL